jgi:outer membrane protein assembly factor BamB
MGRTFNCAVAWTVSFTVPIALGLAGCSDSLPSLPKLSDLNPFAEKQKPLPGKRVAIMEAQGGVGGELASASRPVTLPPQRTNEDWTQPGGTANNAPGHLAFSGSAKQSWTADAGTGSGSAGRLTASPVVYDGRVYTLDAAARVSAISTSGGSVVWRQDLVPEKEQGGFLSFGSDGKGGFGGGLAVDSGRLYAATGYGVVVALDPKSGKKLWEKNLGAPIRASPTAAGERVFVVTANGRFFALAGTDGSELWSSRGLPEQASLISNPSPAVDGEIVVVPFTSGELVAIRISDGQTVWTESLTRTRASTAMGALSDAGRPAIDGGTVFAVGHGGRMIATQTKNGERLWSLSVPGTQTPWVAGESVFVVDTSGQLIAINRRDGKVLWSTKLAGSNTWSGPTLAGGQLWLASNQGALVGVDATTGRVASQQNLGTPVYVAPVVAQGRMYVLTDNARLIALN